MVLVREVVDCLLGQPPCEIGFRCDNAEQTFRPPKVAFGSSLEYSPGCYDASVAQFAFEVKGVTFVRGRDDALCRPKDDDDLIGVLGFAHSVRFRELGYGVRADADRDECRTVVLKVISDLLNKDGRIDRLFEMQYQDFGFSKRDFENIRKTLKRSGAFGFVFENGRWRGLGGDEKGRRIVGESVCALGLIESLDDEQASSHFYVDIDKKDFDELMGAPGDGEADWRELCAVVRKTGDSAKVRMLLSMEEMAKVHRLLESGEDVVRRDVSKRIGDAFFEARKKWRLTLHRELRAYDLSRIAMALGFD